MNSGRCLVAVACWTFTMTAPAAAQRTVAGGTFGATQADSVDRGKLNLLVSLAHGIDSDLPLDFISLAPQSDLQTGGRSTMVAATADYTHNRQPLRLFGTASTYLRYGHRLERLVTGSQSAQLGASVRLPRRGTLEIAQAASYSPSYLYQLLPTAAPVNPGEAIAPNPEFQIEQTDSNSYNTKVALAFGSPRGTRVTTTARYDRTDYKHPVAAGYNLETYAAGARVSRAASRSAAFSVAYEYSAGESGSLGSSKAHRATMGVEYSPALSVSRRLTLSVDLSSSLFEIPVSALNGLPVDRRLYPIQGEARIDYPFSLKWRAVASYRRSVEYVPGMTGPMFTDGSRVRLIGVIGRRIDVSAFAGGATATSVIARDTRTFVNYNGDATFRYALTRAFALYSQYTYYYYDPRGQGGFAPGPRGIYEQHGIRAGIMLFTQPLGR